MVSSNFFVASLIIQMTIGTFNFHTSWLISLELEPCKIAEPNFSSSSVRGKYMVTILTSQDDDPSRSLSSFEHPDRRTQCGMCFSESWVWCQERWGRPLAMAWVEISTRKLLCSCLSPCRVCLSSFSCLVSELCTAVSSQLSSSLSSSGPVQVKGQEVLQGV